MTEKEINLKTIASIRSGYPFRFKIEPDLQGTLRVIQMKDLNQYNEIDLRDVIKTKVDDVPPQHLLQPGDIIFQSRGMHNNCVLVTEAVKQAVADSSLTVISLKSSKLRINPGYLVWYLNHPHTQHQLSRLAAGTNLLRISKSDLEKIEIKLPPLAKQKLIAEIDRLSRREQQLLAKIAQKRQTYIAKSLEIEVIQ